LLLLPTLLLAQTNLDFHQGSSGDAPPGWSVPQMVHLAGYSAELRHGKAEGCKTDNSCAVLIAPEQPAEHTFGALMQTFEASPHRGKTAVLRASVRVEALAPGAKARMWMRVTRTGGLPGFEDSMGDRPITSAEWDTYEIIGDIAPDAAAIELGVEFNGRARIWIDQVTFESVPATTSADDIAAIRSLYARVDAAYDVGDIDAVAASALPDAQIRGAMGHLALTEALTGIMKDVQQGTRYTSRSRVTSIRIVRDTAVVSVDNDTTRAALSGTRAVGMTTRDTWLKTASGWKLKESVPVSGHVVTPPTSAAAARPVVAELKQRAVPLATVEPGAPPADLAAFGVAVGDARIVALGEASHGTHEFFRMKHRLFEYLVREKGFTVFALEANWPESEAVDRYIKEGEGSPRAALAGMYFWTWQTGEMVDLIEWIRAFNKAPGKHPTLSFTSFDMQTPTVAAAKALEFLKKYAPDQAGIAAADYAADPGVDRASAVLKIFDSHRAEMARASSEEEWLAARQAAAIVVQAATLKLPGTSVAYRDQAMASNVEWLAGQLYPNEKIVLWAHNGHVSTWASGDVPKPMGAWLRERYGKQLYVAGFAYRRGEVRAIGIRNGDLGPLQTHTVPASPEGSGDTVLSAAGLPLFFLDTSRLPAGPLATWLADPHSFHNTGWNWSLDDPEGNFSPQALSKMFDGLIFVEEGHASKGY
jgi:erythromycin esterase